MVTKKPRVVIIGAGMAGLTAANKLYTMCKDTFDLCVVEGGSRIGGRINTTEFGGDRVEMGATWIHGIGDSPIYKIALETGSLVSKQPWECMDAFLEDPLTVFEGGFQGSPSVLDSISNVFKNLMDFAQGKSTETEQETEPAPFDLKKVLANACNGGGKISVGSFLRQGLEAYWEASTDREFCCDGGGDKWSKKSVEEAFFAMHENVQRTYTSAGDLFTLDFDAESEYRMYPGEEITIARGYLSVIRSLASVLPHGLIQLNRKVVRIDWQQQSMENGHSVIENGNGNGFDSDKSDDKPVKLHFCDGSVMLADHVVVTVSLGVLKAGIRQDSGMLFSPPLPEFKAGAISRLGFGVVNKLFLQMSRGNNESFPFLQMAFRSPESEFRQEKIPWWMRRTASLAPIYKNSSVLLSWFAGDEALKLESLSDEEIINGVSMTLSRFFPQKQQNGDMGLGEIKFTKVFKSKWGSDPLFLGSYSYVSVGSSVDDLDKLAQPLPSSSNTNGCIGSIKPLQILFAGEATHRTHYSTTHGAYLSGLREANRLLQHYNFVAI